MSKKLRLTIRSFSYKNGIPKDEFGHGGGFVFDCRGILNPGRLEEYKCQTGRDESVKDFLENQTKMPKFLESMIGVVEVSVQDYLARNFTHLEVNFGCTGGQHRSVYATDYLADYISKNYPEMEVHVQHLVQDAKNWINEPI